MDDYIRREDAINALVEAGQRSKRYHVGEVWELNGSEIREAIYPLPPADVRPVVYGKWIESTELSEQVKGKKFCSNCGKAQYCIEITDKTISSSRKNASPIIYHKFDGRYKRCRNS